jgi:hypothetical protein
MAITDEARNHLFNTLREKLGSEDAATMMDMLPPVGWADVARRDDVDRLERRFDRLDDRMGRLDDRMDRLEAALREQTRFYVMCLFAAIAAVSTIVGIAGL